MAKLVKPIKGWKSHLFHIYFLFKSDIKENWEPYLIIMSSPFIGMAICVIIFLTWQT